MAGNESFLFKSPVGILEEMSSHNEPMSGHMEPIKAKIELVQNGYELRYEGKKFIADNLDEALGLIRSWMEMNEKEMSKKDKA